MKPANRWWFYVGMFVVFFVVAWITRHLLKAYEVGEPAGTLVTIIVAFVVVFAYFSIVRRLVGRT